MKTQMNTEELNSLLFRLYVYECTIVNRDPKELAWVLNASGFKYTTLKCKDHYDGTVYWQINVEDKPSKLPTVSVH